MHANELPDLCNHDGARTARAPEHHETRTRWVVAVAALMMVVELVVGRISGSMALSADGWHMATHVGALGLSAAAYWFARTRAHDAAFTFGTGKVHALAGYTSAVTLTIVALLMAVESVHRLVAPSTIDFSEALPVAAVGLAVNLFCVRLLDHDADDEHARHDHNLRAAYFHVLADALTSVLAIAALVAGRYAGWTFLDPIMGIVGAAVIITWAAGLCLGAARQLLDVRESPEDHERVRVALESVGDARVVDLRLWTIAPGQRACIASIISSSPWETEQYRRVVHAQVQLAHLTVEVHRCRRGHESEPNRDCH